tara:strand:- start:253 stop:651 length:399 start_codon:yes stop_codon:yes gene_type:complete
MLKDKNELKKCLMQSSSNDHNTLRKHHTIQIKLSTHPDGIPIFKEFFNNEDNKNNNCTIEEYNIGIRFIVDYHKVCTKLKDYFFDNMGEHNGCRNDADKQWLNSLYLKRNMQLTSEDENTFYFKMLSMPIFY